MLQLKGHLVVRSHGGRGAVPSSPVRHRIAAQAVGKDPMYRQPAAEVGCLVHSRAHQRVTKLDPAVSHRDQTGGLGRVERCRVCTLPTGCPKYQSQVAGPFRRGDEQQRLRGLGNVWVLASIMC